MLLRTQLRRERGGSSVHPGKKKDLLNERKIRIRERDCQRLEGKRKGKKGTEIKVIEQKKPPSWKREK